jgi:predicted AlkP superfamily pyrophosphatase or phosphodiesterase
MRLTRRSLVLTLLAALALPVFPQAQPAANSASRPPKLVLAIVVDQFRYDYLTRYRSEYTGGLKRLLEEGASFTNAKYRNFPTVTAPGHATVLTGATPAATGIVENEWWDRATGTVVTSVSDARTRLLGGGGAGSSPRRLLQSTIGDELKAAGKGGKVIGISFKDRSAILPAGHSADAAYWFDGAAGNFVSSNYYFRALPDWVDEFNKAKPAEKYAGQEWLKHKMPSGGRAFYDALDATAFSNELLQQFALRALAAEKLGAGAKTDVLIVSYSGNDYVGHAYGPDSEEVHDAAVRVDKLIGDLMRAAEAQAGTGNVLTILTADHGTAPVPEENVKRKLPGGRLDSEQLQATLELVLQTKFGGGKWIAYGGAGAGTGTIYLNPATLGAVRADVTEVETVAANALRTLPHVFRVYTRTQLLTGAFGADEVGVAVRNGFHAGRSPNLLVIPDPYWIFRPNSGTTHGSPFDYDTHVPVIFYGPQIKPGRYNANISPNDIAPTLANILDIETPSGSSGRVLTEILK